MDQSLIEQIAGLFGQLSPAIQGGILVILGLVTFATQIAPALPAEYREKVLRYLGPIGPAVASIFKVLTGNYGATKNAK